MNAHTALAAPDKLVQIVRPFVGARLNRARDPNCPYGSYLPRTSAIDVLHRANSVDADVRAVNAAGIEYNWDGKAYFVTWAEVRSITVRGLDADGGATGTTVYENACALRPLHSNGRIAA